MPEIRGKYQHYKNIDLEEYFIAVGVPYIGRKMMSMSSPVMEIALDGDVMTITTTSLIRKTQYSFTLGQEYEEKMPDATVFSVTTILNENEMETKSVIPGNNSKCGRHYMFNDTGCMVTYTHDKAKNEGKRFYRRVD